jgi:hypothetical protein
MGGGEAAGVAGIGESPSMGPLIRGMGPGGLPMKKKVMPKKSPKRLAENKHWKKSFSKFGSKIAGGKGQ